MASNQKSIQATPGVFYAFCKPYIIGARVQLERYLEAQRVMKAYKLAIGTNMDRCIYELSSLLEHLDSIEAYLRGMDMKLPNGETIRQFRNHLRHDVRGEIDHSKGKRAKSIGLNDKLLVEISFTDDGVRMGSTVLTARQINDFINTAEIIAWALLLGGEIEVDGDTVSITQHTAKITLK